MLGKWKRHCKMLALWWCKEIIDQVSDRLRKLVDNCDNVQGCVRCKK